jgi:hypothetical protein
MSQDDSPSEPRSKPLTREKPGALRYGLKMAAESWFAELNREERAAVVEDGSTSGPRSRFLALAEEALRRAVEGRP